MFDLDRVIRRSWPLLLDAIRRRGTISYGDLAAGVGPPLNRRQVHPQLLTPLAERCRRAGLPDLSALVVRKDSGMPGAGWFGPHEAGDPDARWADALLRCYEFPWPPRPPKGLLGPAEARELPGKKGNSGRKS